MAIKATAMARAYQLGSASDLARFFPDATPVRVPVRLTCLTSSPTFASETTVVEFGTAREALFASTLPLEFGDMLRLENNDGTLNTEACVVALQYSGDRTAVAARFAHPIMNWIVK